MAKNKVTEIQKGPDAPVGAETDTNQGGMSADETAALEAAKAGAGEPLTAAGATAPDAAKEDGKKPNPAKKVLGVRITAKVASFRRAGLTFGLTPTDIPVAALTREECDALKAEPMLTVEQIEIEIGQ